MSHGNTCSVDIITVHLLFLVLFSLLMSLVTGNGTEIGAMVSTRQCRRSFIAMFRPSDAGNVFCGDINTKYSAMIFIIA